MEQQRPSTARNKNKFKKTKNKDPGKPPYEISNTRPCLTPKEWRFAKQSSKANSQQEGKDVPPERGLEGHLRFIAPRRSRGSLCGSHWLREPHILKILVPSCYKPDTVIWESDGLSKGSEQASCWHLYARAFSQLKKYISLFGCTGSHFQHVGSSVAVCGIQFPDQRSTLGPLHWECRVLTTGPPGKSQHFPKFKASLWADPYPTLNRGAAVGCPSYKRPRSGLSHPPQSSPKQPQRVAESNIQISLFFLSFFFLEKWNK